MGLALIINISVLTAMGSTAILWHVEKGLGLPLNCLAHIGMHTAYLWLSAGRYLLAIQPHAHRIKLWIQIVLSKLTTGIYNTLYYTCTQNFTRHDKANAEPGIPASVTRQNPLTHKLFVRGHSQPEPQKQGEYKTGAPCKQILVAPISVVSPTTNGRKTSSFATISKDDTYVVLCIIRTTHVLLRMEGHRIGWFPTNRFDHTLQSHLSTASLMMSTLDTTAQHLRCLGECAHTSKWGHCYLYAAFSQMTDLQTPCNLAAHPHQPIGSAQYSWVQIQSLCQQGSRDTAWKLLFPLPCPLELHLLGQRESGSFITPDLLWVETRPASMVLAETKLNSIPDSNSDLSASLKPDLQ